MKHFRQTYRTILAFFFLGIFLNVFITDIACFVGKIDFSTATSHHHSDGHQHSHKAVKKVEIPAYSATFSDNSCCRDETTNFYASVSKIVVTQDIPIELPPSLIIETRNFDLELIIPEISWFQPCFSHNKAPPKIENHLFLLNETFLI